MNVDTSVFARIVNKERQSDGTLVVTGIATDDTLDVDQQICDPEWLERAMPEWFKFGNIREQHSNIAAGVATKYEINGSQHIVTAHVVDPNSVMKVESGVLKGFSIGIRDPRISKDKSAPGGRIVDGEIVEVSLVDRPANPSCMLELAKTSGGVIRQVETLIEKEALMERCKMCKESHDSEAMKDAMCKECAAKAVTEETETEASKEATSEETETKKVPAEEEETAMADAPAEESSQAVGEESSQAVGEESSREGGVAGVAGKEEEDEPDGLAAIKDMCTQILSLLTESGKANSDETTEDVAKSVKLIDERLSKVEKSASRGPARTAVIKAVPQGEEKAEKAATYRAKAAATSDPALASGYLLLASEAESN